MKKNRLNKFFSLLMALVLIMSASGTVSAKADDTLLTAVDAQPYYLIVPGQKTHVTVPVKVNSSYDIQISSIMAVCNNELITVENLKLKYIASDTVIDLTENNGTYNGNAGIKLDRTSQPVVCLDFNIVADDELKIGYNTISIVGSGFEMDDSIYVSPYTNHNVDLLNVLTYTSTEKAPAYLSVSSIDYVKDSMTQGKSTNIVFKVKNEGEIKILNAYMTLNFGDSGIIPDYTVEKIKVGDLAAGASKDIYANIKLLDDAKPGLNEITVSFEGKNRKGDSVGPFVQNVFVTIKEDKNKPTPTPTPTPTPAPAPELAVTTDANYGELKRGEKMTIPITIRNNGKVTAKSVAVTIVEGVGPAQGVTKDFTSNSYEVGDIGSGKSKTVKIPITVSEDVAAGLHEFAFEVKYKTPGGDDVNPATMSMYLEAKPKPEEDKKPDLFNYLDIHNVSQSPEVPEAGGKVSVSFEITNNGNGAVKNLRIYGTDLSSSGFEPLTNEPYQKVGDLPAGASKKTSMTFKVGENIGNGTNTLTIGYEFIDENGEKKSDSASLYILNVKAKEKEDEEKKDVGRPKLIISDYSTDNTILKAGEIFNFTFSIKNTHQTKVAKNIKVTISQAEGIFSPAAGTNIFYIDSIEAGQVSVQSLDLKTRADATTGDYDVMIKLEYEYDDMSDADREKGGVSEENTIKLRATENYRPVIENISINAWEGCYVGTPVDMNFEFYNMGKSTLGNVYITIEGDFALANNSQMSYVGAIQGYGQEFINPQIVPLVEGDAVGILTVHFEDSNGDEVTLSQEFTQYVQSMGGGEYDNPGYDPGFDPGYDPNIDPEFDPDGGEEDQGFFSKIKPWMWIVGGVVVAAAIAVPIIVHCVKKSKKAKVDEDEDY